MFICVSVKLFKSTTSATFNNSTPKNDLINLILLNYINRFKMFNLNKFNLKTFPVALQNLWSFLLSRELCRRKLVS